MYAYWYALQCGRHFVSSLSPPSPSPPSPCCIGSVLVVASATSCTSSPFQRMWSESTCSVCSWHAGPWALLLRRMPALLRVMSIYSDRLLYFSSVFHFIPFTHWRAVNLLSYYVLSTCFPQYKNCVKFILFVSAHVSIAALLYANSSQTFLVFQSWKEQEKPKVSAAAADPCCLCVYCVYSPSPAPPLPLTPTSLPFNVPTGLVRGHAPPVHAPGPHGDQDTNWQVVVQGLK